MARPSRKNIAVGYISPESLAALRGCADDPAWFHISRAYTYTAQLITTVPKLHRIPANPPMSEDGLLYFMDFKSIRADVGQPNDYLIGQELRLAAYAEQEPIIMTSGD